MLGSPLRVAHVFTMIAVILGAVYGSPGAAPSAAASTPAAPPVSEQREHGVAAPTAHPDTDATPAAAADATKTADSCRTAVAGLGSGDVSALKHLSAIQREGIVQGPTALKAFQCLTIADDDSRYCDALSQERKDECLQGWQQVRGLATVPKEQVKFEVIYRSCLKNTARGDCDRAREAWTSGDASKCAALSEQWHRDFCAAIASRDPARCNSITEASFREYCAAAATDDPTRCSKKSTECLELVRGFEKVKKEGVEGFLASVNPSALAARKGRQGCAALLSDLQRFCIERQ